MTTNVQSRPISGKAVRAFRQRLKMRQLDFATRAGVTQAMVCLWETGKNAVGEEAAQRMFKVFAGGRDQPSLIAFLKEFEIQRRTGATLTSSPQVTGMTMTVWRWDDQMDLSGDARALEPAGLITVSLSDPAPAIAIEMPPQTRRQRGSILVFQRSDDQPPKADGIYLIQQGRGGGAGSVMVMETKQSGTKPPRSSPIAPKTASFDPKAIEAVFRLVFEGRYVP